MVFFVKDACDQSTHFKFCRIYSRLKPSRRVRIYSPGSNHESNDWRRTWFRKRAKHWSCYGRWRTPSPPIQNGNQKYWILWSDPDIFESSFPFRWTEWVNLRGEYGPIWDGPTTKPAQRNRMRCRWTIVLMTRKKVSAALVSNIREEILNYF